MLKYQSLFVFKVTKKIIAIFTFVYLISNVETFAEICFTKFYISRISGNFRGSFFL